MIIKKYTHNLFYPKYSELLFEYWKPFSKKKFSELAKWFCVVARRLWVRTRC